MDDHDHDEDSNGHAVFPRRKRVRVAYSGPPAYEIYHPKKSFRFLSTEAIPVVKHHRSQLLHLANVLLEELLQSPETQTGLSKVATPEEARQLKQFSERLADFVLLQRSSLSRRHRMLIWVVRLRAGLIARKGLGEWPRDYGSLARLSYIKTLNLLVSDGLVPNYSLAVFWRSLKLLVERLDTIKHHQQITYYVQCLEMCCAKFALVRDENRLPLFDYSLFCTFDSEAKMYSVNEAFFEETERLFHGLHERLHTYQRLSWHAIRSNVATATAVKYLHASLSLKSQGPFIEFIERDLSRQIYDWHVLIGERERYEHEETFGDPTGRNIIAKWRPDQVDRCVETLAKPKIIQSILGRLDREKQQLLERLHRDNNNNDQPDPEKYSDIELNGLVPIVLNYVFDEILTSRVKRFAQRFVLSAQRLHAPSFRDNDHFPLIIQVYNEYAVYFDGHMVCRGDFAACFVEWVRVACEESTWKGRLPDEPATVNLLFLYEGFFPESNDIIERLSQELSKMALGHEPPHIPLPMHYGHG